MEHQQGTWCEQCTYAALRSANKHPDRTGGCDDDQCSGYPPQSGAKLAASAPELLTAAVDLLDCIDRHDWPSLDPTSLREAIAKAKGES